MTETEDAPVPPAFQAVFRSLVVALQPRGLTRDTLATYWAVLRPVPWWAVRESADALKESRFFPTTGEWFTAAQTLAAQWQAPVPGSRHLDELDAPALAKNDPERDDICKALSVADEIALMQRYGYHWTPRPVLPEQG